MRKMLFVVVVPVPSLTSGTKRLTGTTTLLVHPCFLLIPNAGGTTVHLRDEGGWSQEN